MSHNCPRCAGDDPNCYLCNEDKEDEVDCFQASKDADFNNELDWSLD